MTKWGMKFSETGKSVSEPENVIYTSDKNLFKVDVDADPPHLGILDPLPRMNNLTNTDANPIATEVIFQVEHKLPFTPSVSVYFHVIDTPTSAAYYIGRYQIDFLRLGGSLLYADADEKYFYIRHDFYRGYGVPYDPSPQTETEMQKYFIRVKWMISNARYVGQVGLVKDLS